MDKNKIKGKNTRTVAIENIKFERAQEDSDIMEFSFSSELPVERWWGTEILSHDPSSVNLERAATMNFLWNHDRNVVLGRVESVNIGEDKRGYCKVRWSKKSSIEDYKQDVADGICTNVSFAYMIDDVREVKTGEGEEEYAYYCSWTPLEISLVSVPQDASVGIGRSLDLSENNLEDTENNGRKMEITEFRQEESKRIASIHELANTYGQKELAQKLIDDGATIEAARSAYLGIVTAQPQTPIAAVAPLGFSEKENKSYSMLRAINACLTGDWSKAGFERECSQELIARSKKPPNGNGFFMPVRDLKIYGERATYATGTTTTGGFTVETNLLAENFIDALRNRAVIFSLGAQMLSGLQGNVDIPAQNGVTTTYWVSEGGNLTQSEATFRQIGMRPKTIGALSKFTRQTLLQSAIDIEQFIRRDFAAQMALGIDLAAIAGTGTNNQPTGILNTSGIGSVVGGTNGAAPTWDHIVGLETAVSVANANINTCSYLVNATTRGRLKRTQKFSGTNGDPIWETMGLDSTMNGYRVSTSNQIASNLTKGSGTNLSALLFGDFSSLFVGEWGILEILVNPYSDTDYPSGNIAVRALQTMDVAVRYAQSFAAMTDAITT
jgi:HK97 family phage major capsid protein/HK97 family phage prohead protease